MAGRITRFLREYIIIFSLLTIIAGVLLLLMSMLWYVFRDVVSPPTNPLYFIYIIGEWHAFILVAGFIIFGIGVYYLYSYHKKRKFVLEEIRTDKRSEILKKRVKLESTVKHLPSKYQRMLTEKEDELNIK